MFTLIQTMLCLQNANISTLPLKKTGKCEHFFEFYTVSFCDKETEIHNRDIIVTGWCENCGLMCWILDISISLRTHAQASPSNDRNLITIPKRPIHNLGGEVTCMLIHLNAYQMNFTRHGFIIDVNANHEGCTNVHEFNISNKSNQFSIDNT